MRNFTFEEGPAWADLTVGKLDAVLRGTAQEIGEIAQTPESKGGRLPVDKGQLRNSFFAGVNAPELTGPEVATLAFSEASAEAGDSLIMGWTADHAFRQNSGFMGADKLGRTYNQAGKHFAENAISEGPGIAERLAIELSR